ncbi:MAG: acyclic terpene utilization AtuA family protein, partial [Actinobacteria bacterium]|nr:acyclic terpene utilization AtuA family protein [Actinomycetota bacterium]
YLAELTMLILGRDRMKDATRGYAKTFLRQAEDCLGLALDKGVKIVANAGGLNPRGLVEALEKLDSGAKIGYVDGDDLLGRAGELGLGSPLTANAYLGAWGIVECLNSGADVVVTGRVTDASVIVGPAAAHFGWSTTDYDELAGAVIAGHVIECGTQATGGNYSFFTEIADMSRPGFPIAEIEADGSSVITKHEGTGGAVSVGTVTAQLLYEITGGRYANPDVTARIDTAVLAQESSNRVSISGVTGEAPPPTYKVSLNALGGFRNEFTMVLTGLDIEAKAELAQRQFESWLPARPTELDWTLVRTDKPDAETEETASALLRCVARDSNPDAVGRQFSAVAVELALASYPGFSVTAPPGNGAPYGVFTAGFVDAHDVPHTAHLADGTERSIAPSAETRVLESLVEPQLPAPRAAEDTIRLPLGTIAAARSGDKGGSANVGVWVRTDDEFAWLAHALTVDTLKTMLPEAEHLTVTRHVLPNLRAVNFVIDGILGQGVASQARFDPQAKGLGEWLRSRHIDIPETLAYKGALV